MRSCLSLLLLGPLLWGQGVPEQSPAAPAIPPELQDLWREYEQLVRDHPHRPALRYNFGNLAYGVGEYQRALDEYQAALDTEDPRGLARAYYNMGNSLFRSGKVADSRNFYRKALELNPGDSDARLNYELASLLAEQQQNEERRSPARQPDAEKDNPDAAGEDSSRDQSEEQGDDSQSGRQQEAGEDHGRPEDSQSAQQREAQPADELEREEAEAILNALRANADNLMKRTYGPPAGSVTLEKDW